MASKRNQSKLWLNITTITKYLASISDREHRNSNDRFLVYPLKTQHFHSKYPISLQNSHFLSQKSSHEIAILIRITTFYYIFNLSWKIDTFCRIHPLFPYVFPRNCYFWHKISIFSYLEFERNKITFLCSIRHWIVQPASIKSCSINLDFVRLQFFETSDFFEISDFC